MFGLIAYRCSLHPRRDDEHTLILQYCQTLGGESSPCSQPQSPAQILQAIEREERGELERIIARLEEEQRYGTQTSPLVENSINECLGSFLLLGGGEL